LANTSLLANNVSLLVTTTSIYRTASDAALLANTAASTR